MMRFFSMIGSLIRLIASGFKAIKNLLKSIHDKGILEILKTIKDGFKKILTGSMNTTAWIVLFWEAIQKLLGIIGIGTAIGSGAVGVKQIFDFGNAIIDPQGQMLDWLSEAFEALPSLSELVEGIDNTMYSLTAQYFTPPVTFTYLLQVTGVGACFNQYLQALISTLLFVFSIFLVKWAFSNKFTFTKSLPNR